MADLEVPSPKSWFTISNVSNAAADVFIHAGIGGFGVTASHFLSQIRALKVETLNVHINSQGGSVFEGFAIYNGLKTHPAKVIIHVDALAASIASVIAMAGEEIVMAENAMMMIHRPSAGVEGSAEDIR